MDYFDFVIALEDWCHDEFLRERKFQRENEYFDRNINISTLNEQRAIGLKKLKLFIKDEIEDLK